MNKRQINKIQSYVTLNYVKSHQERLWYINKTVKNDWSRNALIHQIESDLYKKQKYASKTANFEKILSSPQ